MKSSEKPWEKNILKPLITFVVISYNQEQFVREALESALDQTYSPLEIFILDDCSTDQTFKIEQEVVKGYHGPHEVRLYRNEKNLGIGKSISDASSSFRGILFLLAAGDDVSMPTRVEIVFEAWKESGPRVMGLFSSHIVISEDGRERGIAGTRGDSKDHRLFRRLEGSLNRFITTQSPVANGCSAAWSPELLKYFGPVKTNLEDVVLSFRALALGELIYINQPTVKWRRHTKNASFYEGDIISTFGDRERQLLQVDKVTIKTFDNIIDDITVLLNKKGLSSIEAERLIVKANRVRRRFCIEQQMIEGNFLRRLAIIANAIVHGFFQDAMKSMPRALPVPLYRWLYETVAKWRSCVKTNSRNGGWFP